MHQRGELGLLSSPNVLSLFGALSFACYQARQLLRRRKCRPEDFAIGSISAFMAVLNLKSIASQRAPHRPLYLCPAIDHRGSSLPNANLAGIMAVGWLLHLWLPKLFLPTSWPASWRHACAQLSVLLSSVACCLCAADMISDRPQVEYFFAAGIGIYPTLVYGLSLLAAATFQWLATGDGTGCRVVAPYLAMMTVYRASLLYGHVRWDGRPIGAVGAGLAAMVLAILASEAPDRVCSASPMFMYTPSVVKALRCSSLAGVRQWLKETLPSWRASHVVYCLNAMLSVLIYGPLWSRMYAQFTMESERSMWRTTMVDVRTRRMMTVAMSCLAIMVGLASLFADRWRERVNWEGVSCFRFVPTDRHFRTLVVLKCGVLATKIDLLLVRSGAEAHQPMLLVLQLISIATTAGVASWNTIKLHATALDLIGEFNDTFRSPASLLRFGVAHVHVHALGGQSTEVLVIGWGEAVVKATLPSWRASHVMYCLNALMSVLIYGPLWSRMYTHFTMESGLELERAMWRTTVVDVRTRRIMTVAMSCLAIVVGLASLLTDRWRERASWEGALFFRFVPIDRHFRTLVLLKCGVLATKIDLLLVRSGTEAHQPVHLVLQLISIATTAGLASWNTIKLHATALDLIGEFNDTFRSPATLLRATRLGTVMWYFWTAVFLSIVATSDGLGDSHFLAVRDALGFYVWVNIFWLIASNELTLLISSKVSRPQVFEAVQSPTGLRAVLAYISIAAPLKVYCSVCHPGWSGHGASLWLPLSLWACTAGLGWVAYLSSGEHALALVAKSPSRPPQDALPAQVAQV
eukprot:CAMPEP_0198609074 /NCGR_PEP_ID=MMETSP1462-20131121/156211_1 /TAXON_ID=1333877 /ORGANISM="Brandtodinium nutriculum, Strain RCC3387" /LENGTH=804 /DNA_ID=CAMNT_0044340879 /DNA_START=80 /DNA_END=2495 /DNA_ORIENTATION=+